jgi:hypothetical protein
MIEIIIIHEDPTSLSNFFQNILGIIRYLLQPVLAEYQTFHKYLRLHEGLNKMTLAEKCWVTIKGDNKWITLIHNVKNSI